MRHEIFQFIDQSADILHRNNRIYESAAHRLDRFFSDSFSWKDSFLNVHTRIKSEESLREKILRQNLFSQYETPEDMMEDIHDIIGIRIECRFIAEEREIYETLFQLFTEEMEDGYFSSALNEGIRMDLNLEQPQYQKNGFEIYKVDGKVWTGSRMINFELQIKSLVNVFWGEIDHKVLYKNYNYMMTEEFFREMLVSIKENLWVIDKRLMQLYRQIETMDSRNPNTTKDQLKLMLSKLIHDVYIMKLREATGVLFDFQKPSNLIVDFIFAKRRRVPQDQYAVYFVQALAKVQRRQRSPMDFTEGIEYPRFSMDNPIAEGLKEKLLPYVNRDFKWYLLFRILLDIEQTDFVTEFKQFVEYMISTMSYRVERAMHVAPISERDKKRMHKVLLIRLIEWYGEHCELDYLTLDHMRVVEQTTAEFMEQITRPEDLLDVDPDQLVAKLHQRFEP
ncbi:MAG: GTP pyrophosphokinase [Tissierellia bacterium]|jgi:ppGpp synthetase/RelA/SpoT-type nucleotidyltranferase|nr:GTP pyrophosphokinase [Bacillota bacterium]NLK59132.1 GTP pyrophosphokinase [Tissierellia bacterium]